MKLIKKFMPASILMLGIMLMSLTAFAQAQPESTDQFMLSLWQFVGQLHGASVLVIVAGVVQLVMQFFSTSLANFAGKYRLLIVGCLTLVGSVLGLVSQGMTFWGALMNGATLTAFQVLGNQIWVQFIQKGSEVPTPPAA